MLMVLYQQVAKQKDVQKAGFRMGTAQCRTCRGSLILSSGYKIGEAGIESQPQAS
jgi:hypothetical protein